MSAWSKLVTPRASACSIQRTSAGVSSCHSRSRQTPATMGPRVNAMRTSLAAQIPRQAGQRLRCDLHMRRVVAMVAGELDGSAGTDRDTLQVTELEAHEVHRRGLLFIFT